MNEFESVFEEKLSDVFFRNVETYKKAGYIEYDDNSIRLTEKGYLLSNTIIANLI